MAPLNSDPVPDHHFVFAVPPGKKTSVPVGRLSVFSVGFGLLIL